jgi:hypothetical protein
VFSGDVTHTGHLLKFNKTTNNVYLSNNKFINNAGHGLHLHDVWGWVYLNNNFYYAVGDATHASVEIGGLSNGVKSVGEGFCPNDGAVGCHCEMDSTTISFNHPSAEPVNTNTTAAIFDIDSMSTSIIDPRCAYIGADTPQIDLGGYYNSVIGGVLKPVGVSGNGIKLNGSYCTVNGITIYDADNAIYHTSGYCEIVGIKAIACNCGAYLTGNGGIFSTSRITSSKMHGIYNSGGQWQIYGNSIECPGIGTTPAQYDGIHIASNDNYVRDNYIHDWRSSKTMRYGINEITPSNYNIITGNNIPSGYYDTAAIFKSGANTTIRSNFGGYLTDASGYSVGTGSEQTIPHGLAAIPVGCKAWIKIEYPVGSVRYITKDIPFDATNVYPTVDNGVAFEWGIA